jgi:hypothetical protein
MKAMCIDAELAPFKEGDIVTIEPSNLIHSSGQLQVEVLEYPENIRGERTVWLRRRFIPLSDIDETELVKERESDLVLTTPQQ